MTGRQSGEHPLHERIAARPLRAAYRSVPRSMRWGAGIVGILLSVLFIASFFLDEPLRRSMEIKLNSKLKGYSVRLAKLHFQLVGCSLTLKGLTVSSRPILTLPSPISRSSTRASTGTRFSPASFVAEFRLDRPEVHVNLQQLSTRPASKVPLKQQGWQQAVESCLSP